MSDGERRGDLEALLVEHLPYLRAYVRLRSNRAIRARESGTDLVQSVCREVLQGSSGFEYRGDGAFRRWLCTAALRKIVERDRAMKTQKRDVRREQVAATDTAQGALLDAYATVSTPSVVLSRRENIEALEVAFDQLPEEHREVISLAKIVGLSHAEIAEQTGRSEAATRQLLRRALVKLRLLLDRD
ncbi:MAG: sigma-70 family RNA polymerase sigma factor [Planctomycetes bacterium]|nr:sigma-70 family RNA polymerase sigma factor [Planctomycetota bacterium]